MIRLEEISPIGVFGKTHGIKGEINLELNVDFDLDDTEYIIVDIDGIFVPFFINEYRYKTNSTALVLFDDINSEESIRPFFGKTAYVKRRLLPMMRATNSRSTTMWASQCSLHNANLLVKSLKSTTLQPTCSSSSTTTHSSLWVQSKCSTSTPTITL